MAPPTQISAKRPPTKRSGKAHATRRVNGDLEHDHGRGDREARLIEAMIDLCAERGYLAVSVADVSSRAGVSSKTFYELYVDKEDCLLASYRAAAKRLLEDVEPVEDDGEWRHAARTALDQLLHAIRNDPAAARLLLVEALAGGPRIRAERERVLSLIEARAQQFLSGAPRDGERLDVPATAVIGAVRSIVSRQLRTYRQDRLPLMVDDLIAWLESYAVERSSEAWSTSRGSLLAARAVRGPAAEQALQAPSRLPRGRHRLPAGAVARSQRERLIHGTAAVMTDKGYADATVAEIVAAAGISREVFYEHFANKQDAYLAAQRYATQYILQECTAAYFRHREWPDRVWSALQTLINLLVANPELAHLRLVECYAAGADAIEHTEQLKRAATIFLQEGFGDAANDLPWLSAHAISGAVFEVFYTHISRGEFSELQRRLPQLTYIAIAPFMGPQRAVQALERIRDRELVGDERA
jgi:AcrR family transcriptional regulator